MEQNNENQVDKSQGMLATLFNPGRVQGQKCAYGITRPQSSIIRTQQVAIFKNKTNMAPVP